MLYGFDKNTPPTSERQGTVYYDDLHPVYYEVLQQVSRQKTMAYKDSTYTLELNTNALERRYRAIETLELPIQLEVGKHEFKMPFAEDIDGARASGFSPRAQLRMKVVNHTYPDEIDVSINGTKLDNGTRTTRAVFIMNNDTWLEYPLDLGTLKRGINQVVIHVRSLNPQMSATPVLNNVELVVEY